jgi:outer membrane immunogenic protein
MRNYLLASAALAALIGGSSAQAADLGKPVYKAPPPVVPVFSWTGLYIGGFAGGAWNTSDWVFPGPGTTTSHRASSALGGGQIGYNYQVSSWVFGIQGDGAGFSLNGQSVCPNPHADCRTEQKWIASATARVGYAWNTALFYAKGGAAWSHDDYFVLFPATPGANEVNSGGGNRVGWTVGGGLEYAFWNKWSAFVEYDHYDFGTEDFSMVRAASGAFAEHLNVGQRVDVVKAGVNYRF